MRAVAVLMALLLVPSVAGAQRGGFPRGGFQRPGMPPERDSRPPAATGTSRIRGRIVAADTGLPLRRALVRIVAAELREGRSISTDEQGRYEFAALPAGRYTVNASKGGFVAIAYGQLRPLEAGKPVQLGDNETAERIDLRLPRGAVITGRIVDEFGEPVANAMVQALQFRYMNGRKNPISIAAPATTPDTGEFRLWGLGPGEYMVSATLRDPMAARGAVDDGGIGYAPTYYPGTSNPAEAQRITVTVGATLTDITIPLALTKTAKVSGSAVDSDGQPMTRGFVNMVPRSAQGGMMMITSLGAQLQSDGTFTISNVVPGTYIVRANAPGGFVGGGPPVFSQSEVTVDGQDVAGLRLAPLAPVTVRGRLIIDPASSETLRPNAFRIAARPKRPDEMMMMMGPPAAVKDDATFEFTTMPGELVIQLMPSGPTTGWLVKSMRIGGVDVTDTGVTWRGGEQIDDLEIDVTGRVPVVSGAVTTSKSGVATDYTVIAFPQDSSAWSTQAPGRIAITRPDQQGRFQLRTLRPGSYYLVAVEYVEQGQWTDPEYLETIRPIATRLTLGEAETKTVDLKLSADR